MFKSKIKVILTIYEDVQFYQSPSWIFLKGLAYDFWSKFQISSSFYKIKIGPRNQVCWRFGMKLKSF